MQACKTITTVLPPAAVVLVVSGAKPEPLAVVERPAGTPRAEASATRAVPDDSADYRADLLRRYESPFDLGWRHGGLNE